MKERFWAWVAWHLPNRIVYYCIIRAWVHATTGKYSAEIAPAVLAANVIERWSLR